MMPRREMSRSVYILFIFAPTGDARYCSSFGVFFAARRHDARSLAVATRRQRFAFRCLLLTRADADDPFNDYFSRYHA